MVPNHHIYTLSFTRMVFIMDAPLLSTLMLTNLLSPTLLVPKYHAKLYIIFKSQLVVRSLWSSQLSNGLSLIMICPNFPGIISKFIFSCFLFCSITHQLIYSATELSSYASYANQYGPYEVIRAADFAHIIHWEGNIYYTCCQPGKKLILYIFYWNSFIASPALRFLTMESLMRSLSR